MHTAPLHYYRLGLVIGWGLILLVIFLSLAPHPPQPNVAIIPFADKIGHGFAYFTLMSWFAQLYQTTQQRRYLAIGFILLGGGLEILQGMSGVRTADIWDFFANTSGVIIGWLAVTLTKLGVVLSVIKRRLLRFK